MNILPVNQRFKIVQGLLKNVPTGSIVRRFVLLYFVALLLMILDVSAMSGELPESSQPGQSVSKQLNVSDAIGNGSGIIFEEPLQKESSKSIPLPEPDDCLEPSDREVLPRVAIIIDDMGHHKKYGGELLELDLNLTFSFLPHAPFSLEQEESAWRKGRDILVHMPMEPRDSLFDPGPGTLYLKDSAETISRIVQENINRIPHAIGVNNHMGSKFTADRRAMRVVLEELRQRNLFFVDSLTTPFSVGAEEAAQMGIRTGRREIFLDNSQTREDICRQLKRLVAYAKKYGSGIGIGHPNKATIDALKSCRELLMEQVRIVGINELVK